MTCFLASTLKCYNCFSPFFFFLGHVLKIFFFLRVCCCHEDVGFLCFAIILSMPQKEADYFLGLDEER